MSKPSDQLPDYQAPEPRDFINLHRTQLAHYFNALKANYRHLDNQGLALDEDETNHAGKKVSLESLYVFPAVSEQHIEAEHIAKMDDSQVKAAISGLSKVLRDTPRFTLLGDPGIGKSTFIQWLNLALAYHTKNTARDMLGPLLPLTLTARRLQFIESLNYQNHSSEYFLEVLIASMGSVAEKLQEPESRALIIQALTDGQVLLMVDGVDEISPEQSDWLAGSLKQFLADYSGVRLVLTARIVGFNHSHFWFPERKQRNPETEKKRVLGNDEQFDPRQIQSDAATESSATLYPLVYLAPFDNNRRQVYVEYWTKLYLPKKNEIPEFIQSLKKACFSTSYLDALSRNPVLLTMICLIQWRTGTLPNGRSELYQRIVATYLVSLDRARRIDIGYSKHDLPYDHKYIKYWIAKLAWLMQTGQVADEYLSQVEEGDIPFEQVNSRVTAITESELIRFFAAHIAEMTDSEQPETQAAQRLIDFIKRRTGFLIPKGIQNQQEIFAFSHLSFQEYFAGYFITKHWQQWQQQANYLEILRQTLPQEAWQEVWQLAFEETEAWLQTPMLKQLFEPKKLIGRDINLLAVKLLTNTSLRLKAKVKQPLLLDCWQSANARGIKESLSIFWANQELQEWVLQSKSNTHLSLEHLSADKLANFLPQLPEFSQLTHLSIAEHKLENLTPLSTLSNLTQLNLYNTQITDISALAKLINLRALDLSNTHIRDLAVLLLLKSPYVLGLDKNSADKHPEIIQQLEDKSVDILIFE